MVALFSQCRQIYNPRGYDPEHLENIPEDLVDLRYTTSQGEQIAYYLPPQSGKAGLPKQVWMLFPGNGGRALRWLEFASSYTDHEAGFFLLEYPGYGFCQGRPGQKAILESSTKSFSELCKYLATSEELLRGRLNLLGHSMGAATAIQFAVQIPPQKLILVSPFTSLLDMAHFRFGTPLCHLLMERYDNRARLQELALRSDAPQVSILHGTDDDIVPYRMGFELGRMFPRITTFHRYPGIMHKDIIDERRQEIYQIMSL
jgi:uncharacterized protein